MSFLTKIRKVIHTTPVLRQVSKGFANAWGAGEAYAKFDRKIGYSESGEPVPSQDQYQAFGRSDLAALAAERYPGAAALVANYRENERFYRAEVERFTPIRPKPGPPPVAYFNDDGDVDVDDIDYDEDQDLGDEDEY